MDHFHLELEQVMARIAAGEITVRPIRDPASVYAGTVRYTASNGWTIVVFNDCNEWDYIDSVEIDGVVVASYESIYDIEGDRPVQFEVPSPEESWRIWRIPGWITCRCHGCGEVVERQRMPEEHEGLVRCGNCDKAAVKLGWGATHAPMPAQWCLCDEAERVKREDEQELG